MEKLEVCGVPITPFKKSEILEEIQKRLNSQTQTFIITPYSEFIYAANLNDEFKKTLKFADISIADGVGIFVAENFLHNPLTAKSFYGKIFQAFFQMVSVLVRVVVNPSSLYNRIPEKIPGSEFFWDLLSLAEKNNLSVFFLGGYNKTPEQVAEIVKEKFPSIQISGFSSTGHNDPKTFAQLVAKQPDVLFVAYGSVIQEKFIQENLKSLKTKIAIGVGGTFDYVVGNKVKPPKFIRAKGFEWIFRLFTQRKRFRRIINATLGLLTQLLRFKVYESLPFRKNVIAVILNSNKVLVCKRKPIPDKQFGMVFVDYWQLPQGGLEDEEGIEVGARREAQEETGLTNLKYVKISKNQYAYTWRNARRPLLKNPFLKKYRYKGQSQSIVYFEYQGAQTDVKLDNREFVDYQWVNKNDLNLIVHPERREVNEIILRDLENL